MYRLFFVLNPIDPKPIDPNIADVPPEAIWLVLSAVAILTACGIVASVVIVKSIKRRKEKEVRQRLEDKQKENRRDY